MSRTDKDRPFRVKLDDPYEYGLTVIKHDHISRACDYGPRNNVENYRRAFDSSHIYRSCRRDPKWWMNPLCNFGEKPTKADRKYFKRRHRKQVNAALNTLRRTQDESVMDRVGFRAERATTYL